ncbi:HIT family protein [Candidatus Woesearchaeota archaeon]|jgi:diadenosine tetraphosphate (Ap4A) HIT family hydrolase|nr:HIT family protein [Candidatus Woesearchaeota archaeon]
MSSDKILDGTEILYEDDVVYAVIPKTPAIKGHIQVITKKKYKSFESVPDKDVEHLMYTASFTATALFENLQPGGTNIMLDTGNMFSEDENHIIVNVIARNTEDGLNFLWTPQQIPEGEISQIQEKIKNKCDMIGVKVKEKEVLDLDKQKPEQIGKIKQDGDSPDLKKDESANSKLHEDKYKKAYDKGTQEKQYDEDCESYLVKQLRRTP